MNVEGGLRCFCLQSFDTHAKVFELAKSRGCIPSKTGGVLTHAVGMSICESSWKLVIFEAIVVSLMHVLLIRTRPFEFVHGVFRVSLTARFDVETRAASE